MDRVRTPNARALLMAACAAVAMVPGAAEAQQRRDAVSYDIPAQDLGTALTQLGRQSHREIYFAADLTRGKRARRLSGAMTVEQALDRLLAGTGLRYRVNGSGSIVIEAMAMPASTSNLGEDEGQGVGGIADILVVGRLTQNVDIRRTEDDAQPYVVFDAKDVEESQASTLEEFLKSRLPMNAAAATNAQNTVGQPDTTSQIDLRGLGTDQTLILVDGRRMASLGAQSNAPRQADINGIPLTAIERIEILPSSAGGIYGGNAVGGVVNIILKHSYSGVQVRATYQDTFDLHAPRVRFEASGGISLEGGRTRISFNGSYSKSGVLRLRDRADMVARGVDLYRSVDIFAGSVPPRSSGVNVRATSGNLVLDDGTPLGSNITNLPYGFTGDVNAALLANAGSYDLTAPLGLQGYGRGLLASPEQRSFTVGVRRTFAKWLDVFVDYSRFENRGHSQTANLPPFDTTLAADNPNNPFRQNVRVVYDTPTLVFPFDTKSNVDRITAGFIARFGNWGVNFDYTRNWASVRSTFSNSVLEASSGCALAGLALNSASCPYGSPTDTRPLINLFGFPIDEQFEPYLLDAPTAQNGPSRSVLSTPSLRVSGPLVKVPGGTATLTLAAMRDSTTYAPSLYQTAHTRQIGDYYFTQYPGRFQRSTAEYAEVTVPLISPRNDIPLVHQFQVTGSVRADQYFTRSPEASATSFQTVGATPPETLPDYDEVTSKRSSRNFTVAARWAINSGIAFRASHATGFLPPNVTQIADQVTVVNSIFTDPMRGNERITRQIESRRGSGSLTLRPELSRSLSVGVILTPDFLKGLRVSADYTRIRKRDEIVSINTQDLINYEAYFPDRISRGANLGGDPASYAGVITGLDTTPVNAQRTLIQTVDFQADYRFGTVDVGQFRLYAIGTWQPEFTRQLLPPLPALNRVGYANGPLEWRANGGVDWQKGPLQIQWNAQFYDSYFVYLSVDPNTSTGATQIAQAIAEQGEARIPSQMYHDLSVSYRFPDSSGVFNGLLLSGGVQNVFNTKPPVVATATWTGVSYSGYGDPRLRRFTLSIRKDF